MKTIKFLALIMTLFFTAIQLNAQWEVNCESDCDVAPALRDTTFYHPNFPNCPIFVEYYFRKCPNGKVEIITNRIAWGTGSGCAGLEAWLQTPGSEFSNSDLLWVMAYRAAAEHDFMTRYKRQLLINEGFLLECPNGSLSYEFHRAQCVKFCAYDDSFAQQSWLQQIVCNANACCKIERRICFNTTTQQMEITEIRTQENQGANCETTIILCPASIVVGQGSTTGPRTIPLNPNFSTECGVPCD